MTAPTKGEQTRAAILDEALKIASKLGLEGLTIGSLADATGMSKSGLFAISARAKTCSSRCSSMRPSVTVSRCSCRF